MRAVLGIDAAWTEREPSGVALVANNGSGWHLVEAAGSYDAFFQAGGVDPISRHRGSVPDAPRLLAAAAAKVGATVDLVAVDMPLSMAPITSRRPSDNMISTAYGARHASTHTPSATRPGRLSDELRIGFENAGYPLAVSALHTRSLIEVYPHPARIELAAADRRLPYKQSKMRKYWPDVSPAERRANLLLTWTHIIELLDVEISGVRNALAPPPPGSRGHELKAFEDTLDAVVCAWVGACALDGRAKPYGHEMGKATSSISLFEQVFDLSCNLSALADRDVDVKMPTGRDDEFAHGSPESPDSIDRPRSVLEARDIFVRDLHIDRLRVRRGIFTRFEVRIRTAHRWILLSKTLITHFSFCSATGMAAVPVPLRPDKLASGRVLDTASRSQLRSPDRATLGEIQTQVREKGSNR